MIRAARAGRGCVNEGRLVVWMLALLGAGAIACGLAASPSRAEAPALRVSARNALLSVEAQAAPWVQLLDEVSRETGTRFHLISPLPGSVTMTFQDLPPAQALRRLFGPNVSYALRFREADARSPSPTFPSEVWVLGRRPGKSIEAAGTRSGEEVEKEFARDPRAAREAALGSTDPDVRGRAILHFGWQGDHEALHVLAQVAKDRDPEIRRKAVDALELFVDQPAMLRSTLAVLGRLVGQHPRVREVLTHVMRTAEQADIRRLAADSLGAPLDDTTNLAVPPGTDRGTAR
jgi:HEAT repeats